MLPSHRYFRPRRRSSSRCLCIALGLPQVSPKVPTNPHELKTIHYLASSDKRHLDERPHFGPAPSLPVGYLPCASHRRAFWTTSAAAYHGALEFKQYRAGQPPAQIRVSTSCRPAQSRSDRNPCRCHSTYPPNPVQTFLLFLGPPSSRQYSTGCKYVCSLSVLVLWARSSTTTPNVMHKKNLRRRVVYSTVPDPTASSRRVAFAHVQRQATDRTGRCPCSTFDWGLRYLHTYLHATYFKHGPRPPPVPRRLGPIASHPGPEEKSPEYRNSGPRWANAV